MSWLRFLEKEIQNVWNMVETKMGTYWIAYVCALIIVVHRLNFKPTGEELKKEKDPKTRSRSHTKSPAYLFLPSRDAFELTLFLTPVYLFDSTQHDTGQPEYLRTASFLDGSRELWLLIRLS